jgi:DNA-directed RNA polymerase subunit beta'
MIKDFQALRIKLASPEDVLSWSYGEVTKAETINYRTFRPEPDGLMDERVFGPTKDFECFCGKYKKIRYKGIVCDRCGVEVTHKRVRRERMGHIRLVTPVTHVWFAHGVPNRLSLILEIPQKKLETVIYYARYLVTEVDEAQKESAASRLVEIKQEEIDFLEKELEEKLAEVDAKFADDEKGLRKEHKDEKKLGVQLERSQASQRKEVAHIKSAYNQKRDNLEEKFNSLESLVEDINVGYTLSEEEYRNLTDYGLDFFTADMGAPAIKNLLLKLDLETEIKKLEEEIETTKSATRKSRAIQRKRLLRGMVRAGVRPDWIVLEVLPVLPPDLRPIIQLPGGRFATSDLNDLYRRAINRNNRLKRLIELGAPQVILRNERRMLQESVDALMDNSHRPGSPTTNARGLPYKSLSDQLRGKQGRFRQNLLGKRVDYSGRAVIVPGPELNFYQCGLPKTVALELFRPFVMRELIARGLATNPAKAKLLFEEKVAEVWDILEEVSKNRPVLLNRAPSLHKQSIVGFYPILIEGNSIQLHPMMCRGYNADFDGDQMAVHLPLSQQAVEEVKERMLAHSNMLSMASGDPIVNTEKDMALGVYFLTLMQGEPSEATNAYATLDEAKTQYSLNSISLYQPIKLRNKHNEIVTTTVGRAIFNEALPADYKYINETLNLKGVQKISADIFNKYGRVIAIEVLDKIKALGFKYVTRNGFSISVSEFQFNADEMVADHLENFRKKEDELVGFYYEGFMTAEELSRKRQEEWMKAADAINAEAWQKATLIQNSNLVHLNASGATPVASWVKNISGVRGYVTDVTGAVVPLPLMGNYRRGLNNFEYFVAAKNTRKAYADVALRTADSGYLTRRLVDIAQNVVIQDEDCGTDVGIDLLRNDHRNLGFEQRLHGRYLAQDLADAQTGEIIAKRNDLVDVDLAKQIAANTAIEKVKVRSPLTCKCSHGLCVKCYGIDLGTGEPVKVGEAVGVIAAQSLGEPTTQLTLKNKSDARARGDVTQGLPRVEELFELRTPKAKALIADIDGTVKIIENEDSVTVRLSTVRKLRRSFNIGENDQVMVKRLQTVKQGEVLIQQADGTEIKAEHEGKIEIAENKLYLLIEKEVESEMTTNSIRDLLVKNGDFVEVGTQLTYGSIDPKELADYTDVSRAQKYIIDEVQAVYAVYGIPVDDVHLEVITTQMGRFAQITDGGDSIEYLPSEYADVLDIDSENKRLAAEGKRAVQYERTILGLTSGALRTESFLSAASFEQQVRVLTDAALIGKIDYLRGLKENVIIGRPVPIGNVLLKRQQGDLAQNIEFSLGNGSAMTEYNQTGEVENN